MYWNTVTPLLKNILIELMNEPLFDKFRLVGGTALSLQIGHRISVDIDLFTDNEYGSVDFKEIERYFQKRHSYFDKSGIDIIAMGTSYFIGNSKADCIKIDLYYTDNYAFETVIFETIRMASVQEIIAMKLDIIQRGGRKKDFWDLHFFLNKIAFNEMCIYYEKRYPYNNYTIPIKKQILNFSDADNEFEPICLLNKSWELIKLDFIETIV